MKVTAQSFTPQPITILLETVYDVRSWLAPCIEELHGHSQPHCFRFTLNEHGQTVMDYKNWSHNVWSKEGLILLKVIPCMHCFLLLPPLPPSSIGKIEVPWIYKERQTEKYTKH